MNYQKPKRRFERSGFVNPETAYYVPLENVTNLDNEDMKTMVDHGRYFSIFAPRQSGKTTFFHMFSKSLKTNPHYIFILMSFENYKDYDLITFYQHIQKTLYNQLTQRLEEIKCHELNTVQTFLQSHKLTNSSSFYLLFVELNQMITHKKIVIFIDEFDGIPLDEINNFLTTLRKLYQEYKAKKEKALYSVGLIGIRNITQLTVGGVSPFNIADYVELPPFNFINIRDLYNQYTQETNQQFTEKAVQKILEQTQGQPWLVNRLGNILTTQVKPETTDEITLNDVEQAIQMLMLEKNDHFDNLSEKVLLYKNSFKTILTQKVQYLPYDAAQSLLIQYGLIKKSGKHAVIANPIYQKVLSHISSSTSPIFKDQKKRIFISYSHKDRPWIDRLVGYLDVLKMNDFEYWFDDNIQTGDNWSAKIQTSIETSHITICMLSNHFLASSFIQKREIPAIQTRQKEGMIVFPILIKECLWKVVPWFKNMQIYPKGEIPLEKSNETEQNEKFMEIISNISEMFDQNAIPSQ
ncbi:protein containing ATPase domain, prokaryote [Candidatus Magnetomorum sp. HK-1]|nr:protein containing ATPase domain, prokaryote [Candidatus Magnetomorum sp. HK-1]